MGSKLFDSVTSYRHAGFFVLLVLMIGWTPSAVLAQSPRDIPVEAFAKLPEVDRLRQSPNGQKVAFISHVDDQAVVVVQNLDGSERHIQPSAKGADIFDFAWANNDRLLVMYQLEGGSKTGLAQELEPVLQQGTGDAQRDNLGVTGVSNSINLNIRSVRADRRGKATRLAAVDADGSDFEWIVKPSRKRTGASNIARPLANPAWQTDVVDLLPSDPDHILVAVDGDFDERPEIRRININNGRFSNIHDGFRGADSWRTDGNSEPRFAWGFWKDKAIAYLRDDAGNWSQLTDPDWTLDYEILGYDNDKDQLVVLAPTEGGTTGLFYLDASSGTLTEQIFANEDHDVRSIPVAGSSTNFATTGYTNDFNRYHFTDKGRDRLYRAMKKALPDYAIEIVDYEPDEGRYLILASNDTEPGLYFQYDRKRKQLAQVSPTRMDIFPEQMSATKPLSIPVADGTAIPAYLTLPLDAEPKNLPAVVLIHDGPKKRADAHWDYWAQFLASRGYAVLKPNFRGSGGYGTAFESAGYSQWGGIMQSDVSDAVRHMVEEGIFDPERICIAGMAYGGYSALMGVIQTPDLFQCAVSVNGMTNLEKVKENAAIMFGDVNWPERVGLGDQPTSNVSPFENPSRISRPVLLMAAKDDDIIDYKDSQALHRKLENLDKDSRFVLIEKGGHKLSTKSARQSQLSEMESFLKKHIGG